MATPTESNPSLELAEVIKALRHELTLAQTQGQSDLIKFTVNSVEIELQTVIEKQRGAGAKINFKVVSAEGSGNYKQSALHKIKLSLQVVEKDRVSGQDKNLQLGAVVETTADGE